MGAVVTAAHCFHQIDDIGQIGERRDLWSNSVGRLEAPSPSPLESCVGLTLADCARRGAPDVAVVPVEAAGTRWELCLAEPDRLSSVVFSYGPPRTGGAPLAKVGRGYFDVARTMTGWIATPASVQHLVQGDSGGPAVPIGDGAPRVRFVVSREEPDGTLILEAVW